MVSFCINISYLKQASQVLPYMSYGLFQLFHPPNMVKLGYRKETNPFPSLHKLKRFFDMNRIITHSGEITDEDKVTFNLCDDKACFAPTTDIDDLFETYKKVLDSKK